MKTSLPHWNTFSSRQKIILASGVLFIVTFAGLFFFLRPTPEDTSSTIPEKSEEQTAPSAPISLGNEKNAVLLTEPFTLATTENQNIATVLLNDEAYLITNKDIVSVREDKHYVLPAESGESALTAPMNDLGFIFIYTDIGKLFVWNPINHAFIQNTLLLPEKAIVKDMDAYLTYLYVLDKASDQIYRFPRAEGGFGQPTSWIKDAITLEENTQMAISENIFLATDKDTVQMFSRGRYVKNLESPNTPLVVTNIFARPDLTDIYALDRENKRVIVWNQDGALIAQYFSEKLSEAQTINVNEKTNELLITTPHSLLSFSMR